ncbi:nucleoside-diphosphate-sugar epimerase [Ilyonectria destructans]|nr:nucleoside-diphosphate-sugar epimerase [Ilyonectria destructans]
MHLILTGATGLVGSGVLQAMLASKEISKVSILSRRAVPAASNNPKVNVIIHQDFENYEPQVLSQLQGANGVVWALGISALKVTKEDYVKITRDWPLASAKGFADLAPDGQAFRFIYVSGGGATQNPNFFTAFYGRVKGETETLLSSLRTPRLHIESVRPAGVDAFDHDAIKPFIPNPGLAYRIMGVFLGPLFRTLIPFLHSPTEPLGKFLVGMAVGKYDQDLDAGGKGITTLPGGLRVLDNWAFRRLCGLP